MKFEDLLFAVIKSHSCYGHITGIVSAEQTSEGWLCTCRHPADYSGYDKITVELTDLFMFLWQPQYQTMTTEMLESNYCLIKMELNRRGKC